MSGWNWATSALGLATVVALLPTLHTDPGATYASNTPLLVLETLAALALLAVAATGLHGSAAPLLALCGATWLVPELAGAAAVDLPARTLAEGWTLAVPVLVVLALTTHGRPSRTTGLLLVVATLSAMSAMVARIFLVDPFLDADCWRTCSHNPLLLATAGPWGAPVYTALVVVCSVALAGAVAEGMAEGMARGALAPRPVRPVRPIAAVALIGVLLVGSLGRLLGRERADETGWVVWFVVVQGAALVWLATVIWETWQRRLLATRLTALLATSERDLGAHGLVTSLRAAVGDPQLNVAYHASVHDGYVNAAGAAVPTPLAARGRSVTTVTRAPRPGQPVETVAVVEHAMKVNGDRLRRSFGPALTLALANEQLRAESLAELDQLRRSRARVVERAALERSRLERNLHDGAQQGVVALSLLVRVLGDRVDEGSATGLVERAAALCTVTVEELRRVARGLYPAVLADAGLDGALRELAESSQDLPVDVAEVSGTQCSGTVESTAYVVAQASLEGARRRNATVAVIRCHVVEGSLRLTVDDDATPPDTFDPESLLDQAAALGGHVRVGPGVRGTRVELALPCG